MNQKKKYPLILFALLLGLNLFAQTNVDPNKEATTPGPEPVPMELPPPPPPPPPPVVSEDVLHISSKMPIFPGCEDVEDYSKRKSCGDKKLIEYVYANLEYPKIAKDNNVQGTVVIQFVVKEDGTIGEAKVLRDIGAQCGKAGLAVVNKMNTDGLLWEPGSEKGQFFNLPIKFKLPKK